METQDETSSVYRILLKLFPSPAPPLPTVSITSFAFVGTLGGTSATPTVQCTNANATSMTVTLYQSASDVDDSFSVLSTQTPTPTGTNTINFTTTIAERWYYYTVIVTNATGSASASTSHLQNTAGPPPPTFTFSLSSTQLMFPGTTEAIPTTTATISPDQGSSAKIDWSLYQYDGFGFPDDSLVSSGTITGPLDNPQSISSDAYTGIGKQFYYFAQISGGPDGKEDDVSTLSDLNNPPA